MCSISKIYNIKAITESWINFNNRKILFLILYLKIMFDGYKRFNTDRQLT